MSGAFILSLAKTASLFGRHDVKVCQYSVEKRSLSLQACKKSSVRLKMCVSANAGKIESDDDDEAFGGVKGEVYGMQLPNLSMEDKKYLDGATNDRDFMRRMVEIAHRMDQRRHIDSLESNRQTPDEYVEGLSRVRKADKVESSGPKPGSNAPANVSLTKDDEVSIPKEGSYNMMPADVDDIEKQIAELNRQLVEASESEETEREGTDFFNSEKNKLDLLEEEIERLNKKIENVSDESEDVLGEDESWENVSEDDDMGKRLERIQHKLKNAVEKGAGMMNKPISPAGRMSPKEREDKFRESEALRQKIRNEMGSIDKTSPNASETTDDRIASLERQIAAVRREMEKLAREGDMDDGGNDVQNETDDLNGDWSEEDSVDSLAKEGSRLLSELERSNTERSENIIDIDKSVERSNVPSFEGLENTPGEFSADEKRKAFETLRQQAMNRQQRQNEFTDPYNVVLPDSRKGDPFADRVNNEELVSSSDEVDDDAFEFSRGNAKDIVAELEREMKKYMEESRRLLRDHEAKMNVLFGRLTISLDE